MFLWKDKKKKWKFGGGGGAGRKLKNEWKEKYFK